MSTVAPLLKQQRDASSQSGNSSVLPVVAHIMPWSGIGGVEVATLRLVQGTRSRFQHIAYVLADAADLRQRFLDLGVPVRTYMPPTPSIRHGLRFLAESRFIAGMLRRDKVEITHFADMKAAEHNSMAAQLAGCRQICHVRVSMPRISFRNRLTYLPVDRFVFVSREAQQSFGFARARRRSQVIYDAVDVPTPQEECDPAVWQELEIAEGRTVVGMVARVSAQKDYRTLAAAAASVLAQYPDTLFLVVGDNSLVELNRRHYEEVSLELERLGVRRSFLFTGHRNDVGRLIRCMNFCVLSTHREGFPLTLLEIMAESKPVVATSVGGIPEIVHPGANGYLSPHGDAEALSRYILQLLRDPEEVARMGRRARSLVLEEYSPQRFADEITHAYRSVLKLPGQLDPASVTPQAAGTESSPKMVP